MTVLQNKLSSSLDENQPPEQAAYRRGFSTIDHLHAVTQVPEKTMEYNIPLYIAFVDYENTFDSIQHRAGLEALMAHGVQEKYINIIKGTYAEGTTHVRTEKCSGKIKIMKGVHRDDTKRKKTRGRPKGRWRDHIEEVGSSQWIKVAQNRCAWNEL